MTRKETLKSELGISNELLERCLKDVPRALYKKFNTKQLTDYIRMHILPGYSIEPITLHLGLTKEASERLSKFSNKAGLKE